MGRLPSLVGEHDPHGRRIAALSHASRRPRAARLRGLLLAPLVALEEGEARSREEALRRVRERHPRVALLAGEATLQALWGEAQLMGIVARGALTSYGRALLAATREPENAGEASATLDALLPAPIEYVLAQPDLTIIAPGPLAPTLEAALRGCCDIESTGGATVYRATAASLTAALETGVTPGELHALFRDHSRTPIPAALTHLIDDVARRHGRARIGRAGSYLRSDDPVHLAALLADPRLAPYQLRALAPTVAVSPLEPRVLAVALADAGHEAAPEDHTGALALATHPVARTHARPDPPLVPPPSIEPERLASALALLRRSDRAARAAAERPAPQRQDAAAIEKLAGEAMAERALVTVGYIDPHGTIRRRALRPTSLAAGYLRGDDPRTDSTVRLALHRLVSIEQAPQSD
jgi:hypothetical protein